ncbi:DsbA family protein [Lentilactobacillus senioris]|uniref:DsbA family protein n=1 Tax=Lentilactobacillus senioris TaxID=931534 RepID=UPI00227EA560|nr:DsbA family protein [Lentilactobacillus senioris]MCY9807593.1 DsbA family protein [Lentilactobacillus senioris]
MILEMYLFIDPLNSSCYEAEQNVLTIASQLDTKSIVHFVPMLNIQILHEFAKNNPTVTTNEELHYNIILDYQAASFQGKRKGRQFLLALQKAVLQDNLKYNEQLVNQIITQIGLDSEMFAEDRRSEMTKQVFQEDQQTAHELKIKDPNSVVIFNSAIDDSGLLLRDFNYASLFNLCQYTIKTPQQIDLTTAPEHTEGIADFTNYQAK